MEGKPDPCDSTVVIPNFNTGRLLELCLKSLARYGPQRPRIIVIDNGSADDSLRHAETCGYAEVVLRAEGNQGAVTHAASLDHGLALCRTPFFVTLDSDTFLRRNGALDILLDPLREHPNVGVVGAFKFHRPRSLVRRMRDRFFPAAGAPEYTYVRPCHAAYRLSAIRAANSSFAPAHNDATGGYMTTGEKLYHDLLRLGWNAVVIAQREMEDAIAHIGHATVVRNPDTFPKLLGKTRWQGERRIARILASHEVQKILEEGG